MANTDAPGTRPSVPPTTWLPATWLPTALLGVFTFVFATAKIRNFDIWWHLRTGEWILQNGRVPQTDPFSFTAEGTPWVVHYWLSDVLFAWLNRLAGVNGLIVLSAAVMATTFVIVHRIMVRRGVDPFLAALLLGIAVVAARFRFMVRPHIFMFLFSALFLLVLTSDLRAHPRRLLWLVPVMLLWVNMHGSFVLAFLFTGALFAERLLAWALARRREPVPSESFPLWIGATLLGLIVLTFVSPFGLDLPLWVLRDFTSHAVTRSFELEEHAALAWGAHPLVWGLLFATVGSFVAAGRRGRVSDALVMLALAVLAIRSVRLAALASVVFALVLGTNLAPWVRASITAGRVRQSLAAAGLAIAGVAAFAVTYTPEKVYRFGLGIMDSRYPVSAADFLRGLDFEGNVLNTWEFGGYLLWSVPGAKTFADGRTLDGHMDAVARTKAMTGPELGAFVQQYDVRAFVVKKGDEPYAGFAGSSPAFQAVFLDDQAAVYFRQDLYEELAALGRIESFRWIRPASTDVSYLDDLALSENASEVEAELRRAVALSPESFQPHYMLAHFLEAQDRPEALGEFEAAAALNPALAFTHYDLGRRAARLALRLQEWDRAVAIVEMSLPFGESSESHFLLGTALQMTERLDEAERAFQRVLEEDPQNVATLVNLGFVYLDSDRPGTAIQAFTAALGLSQNHENARYGVALAYQRNGQTEQAIQLWRDFLTRFPASRWTPNARRFLAEVEGGVG